MTIIIIPIAMTIIIIPIAMTIIIIPIAMTIIIITIAMTIIIIPIAIAHTIPVALAQVLDKCLYGLNGSVVAFFGYLMLVRLYTTV